MASYEEGFTPGQSTNASKYDDGFTPHPIQPQQTGFQKFGQDHPFLASIPATIASGGKDFANALGYMIPGYPADNTNYYNKFGVEPNGLTDFGQALVSAAPQVLAPEAAIARLGLSGIGKMPALARALVRGGAGAGSNELDTRSKGLPNNLAADALHAGIFAGTGAIGDVLPYTAARLVDKMQGTRLSDQMIEEGNRQAMYPDVGNVVGSPSGKSKWDQALSGWGSPAKDIQERSIVGTQNSQYAPIQEADQSANALYSKLGGSDSLHDDISAGIKENYEQLTKAGNKKFDAIQPEINAERINDHSNVESAARDILAKNENNRFFGVTDKEFKDDLVNRANNAMKMRDAKGYPLDLAIEEERGLSKAASNFRAQGKREEAKYYSDLSAAHEADINAVLEKNNPELLEKLQGARDFWKNNVIPYDKSPVVRKILTNNFDEEVSPKTLSGHLTNGSHDQLLSTLPQQTKDKIAADLLFKKTQNALGQTEHPSVDVVSAIDSVHPADLNKVLPADHPARAELASIYDAAKTNKGVLGGLGSPTTAIDGGDSFIAKAANTAINPHDAIGFLGQAANSPNASFWTKLLSQEENPKLLGAILQDKNVSLNDIRAMTQPKTALGQLGQIANPASAVTNILSRPNYLRAPIEVGKEAVQNKESRRNHG